MVFISSLPPGNDFAQSRPFFRPFQVPSMSTSAWVSQPEFA